MEPIESRGQPARVAKSRLPPPDNGSGTADGGPAADAPSGRCCEVAVVHGDLAFTRHPVMVGHYAGDPLLSSEAALDRRLEGALTARNLLGLYPREIGSHEVILRNGADDGGPQGALVVGLGDVGTLTPAGLTRSVEEAVVRYGQAWRERARHGATAADGGGELGLSSLLIGSGTAGIEIEQSVASILLGVRLANQRLRQVGDGSCPTVAVCHLELIELYRDRAIQALRVLCDLSRIGFGDFTVRRDLVRADGGAVRASPVDPGGWWLPVSICRPEGEGDREDGGVVLELIADDRRARVKPERVQLQPGLIERLLAHPAGSARPDHQRLAETLFELLFPPPLKKRVAERHKLLLVVDETAARYPWELLIDRLAGDAQPIGAEAGLVRQLRLARAQSEVCHSEEQRALVIGDPPSALDPLPGARAEARRVADLLAGNGWQVVRQIRDDEGSEKGHDEREIDAASVVTRTMTADPRILHLAGHGVYRYGDPEQTGMVIGSDGGCPGRFILLSPAEVAQMRLVPDLVFVNCCTLGRIESTPLHLLAANLATQLIAGGVRAVVAAGWAVDDAPAALFAEVFYRQLLAGRTFGDAVHEARRKTFEAHPTSSTWAAYQCYGDPGFRLPDSVRWEQREAAPLVDPVDPAEVEADLHNLLARAGNEHDGEAETVRRELERIEDLLRDRGWLRHAELSTGLARAWAELGDLDRGIAHYEAALAIPSAAVSVRDLEQLANLRAHRAAERTVAEPAAREEAREEIRRSIRKLELLGELAVTGERSALLGSAYRRLAQVLALDARSAVPLRRALRQMARHYADAVADTPEDPYPTINALFALHLLRGPWPAPPEPLDRIPLARRDRFESTLRRLVQDLPTAARRTFHDHCHLADASLLQALHAGRLAERLGELTARYRSLLHDYGSPRKRAQVTGHVAFLIGQLRRQGRERKQHAERLDWLLRAVAGDAQPAGSGLERQAGPGE